MAAGRRPRSTPRRQRASPAAAPIAPLDRGRRGDTVLRLRTPGLGAELVARHNRRPDRAPELAAASSRLRARPRRRPRSGISGGGATMLAPLRATSTAPTGQMQPPRAAVDAYPRQHELRSRPPTAASLARRHEQGCGRRRSHAAATGTALGNCPRTRRSTTTPATPIWRPRLAYVPVPLLPEGPASARTLPAPPRDHATHQPRPRAY
jgi:hypothetical protein